MSDSRVEPIVALYAALAKAQGEFEPIIKNRSVTIKTKPKDGQPGGSYNFRYADLEEVLSKTRPALSKYGLAIFQLVTEEEVATSESRTVSRTVLRTVLTHSDGGKIEAVLALNRAGDDIKTFGASVSYLRRYQITPMLGVAADDDADEDGEGAGDIHIEEHADMKDAKNISALTRIMNQLSSEDKRKYSAYFNVRQRELQEGAQS